MAEPANHNPDPSSTIAVDPGAALAWLVERRLAVLAQINATDDGDDVDAAYEELDHVDERIAATPANALGGIRLKAGICHELACGDADLVWPMLWSLMRDLAHVPLDDVALLRAVFAELAVPVPPRSMLAPAGAEHT
jgi:hypothetical protein